MARYLLAYMVEPLGEETFSRWPLHITLVPWFEYGEGEANLINDLSSQIPRKVRMIKGRVGQRTWFGYDLPVRLVEPKDELKRLHDQLLEEVEQVGGGLSDKTFAGPRYNPHITVRGQRVIEGGQKLSIDKITLVKAISDQPQLRQKVAEFNLK